MESSQMLAAVPARYDIFDLRHYVSTILMWASFSRRDFRSYRFLHAAQAGVVIGGFITGRFHECSASAPGLPYFQPDFTPLMNA